MKVITCIVSCFRVTLLRGTIVDRTCDTHKKLYLVYFTISIIDNNRTVDKLKVGTEGRQTWCMGFLLFPRFSSFRKVMSDPC